MYSYKTAKVKFGMLFLFLFFISIFKIDTARSLSVEEYLSQVTDKNFEYKGNQEESLGFLKHDEIDKFAYSPKFFSTIENTNDRRKTISPIFQGTSTKTRNFLSGFESKTTFGSNVKLYYQQTHTSVQGANNLFVTMPSYYYSGWFVEITQNLWQNGFGRQTNAQQLAKLSTSMSQLYTSSYKQKEIISNAETKFFELASVNEKIESQKYALEIAQKTYDFLRIKTQNNLADRGDLFQIEVYLNSRKYDIEKSLSELEALKKEFNAMRGFDSEEVSEKLDLPDVKYIFDIKLPKVSPNREDVKTKEENLKTNQYNYKASIEDYKPKLDLVYNGSLTGRDASNHAVMMDANRGRYPYSYVGVNFSVPLDFWNADKIISGYKSAERGSKMVYDQTIFESKMTLEKLITKFENDKKLLVLSHKVLTSSQKRVEEERKRYKLGKTTLFILCTIENEYLNAKIEFVNLRKSVLSLYSQIKTYAI